MKYSHNVMARLRYESGIAVMFRQHYIFLVKIQMLCVPYDNVEVRLGKVRLG